LAENVASDGIGQTTYFGLSMVGDGATCPFRRMGPLKNSAEIQQSRVTTLQRLDLDQKSKMDEVVPNGAPVKLKEVS